MFSERHLNQRSLNDSSRKCWAPGGKKPRISAAQRAKRGRMSGAGMCSTTSSDVGLQTNASVPVSTTSKLVTSTVPQPKM